MNPNDAAPFPTKAFLLLQGTLLLYSVVSVFAKLAGNALYAQENVTALVMLGLEFLTLLVYSVLWQQCLKRMPLNTAYSSKGICTLWTCLFGVLFFGERLTWGKALGLAVVLLGVWLVVTDHE